MTFVSASSISCTVAMRVILATGPSGLGGSRHIVTYDDNPPLLRCVGDEDRATQSLRRQALSRALHAPADVVVDLTELVFADASLMLDLAMVARRLRKAGRKLMLHGAQPDISTLIEYVGIHRLPGVTVAPSPSPA
jgi:anti-anti-sigma regulatory factor